MDVKHSLPTLLKVARHIVGKAFRIYMQRVILTVLSIDAAGYAYTALSIDGLYHASLRRAANIDAARSFKLERLMLIDMMYF